MVIDRLQKATTVPTAAGSVLPHAAFDFIRILFGMVDILRRAQGDVIGAFGLDPSECAYRIAASGPYWRLRDYGNHATSHSLLIVAAPIKRPYIWDFTPSVSAVRYCLHEGMRVHLLEWMPASQATGNSGLDECALSLSVSRRYRLTMARNHF